MKTFWHSIIVEVLLLQHTAKYKNNVTENAIIYSIQIV